MTTPNWRTQWVRYGSTPYYYFNPKQLGNGRHLKENNYWVTGFGWISLFLWIFLFFSIVSWWWWDWMLIVWPIVLGVILLEWGVGYGGLVYFEPEAYKKNDNNPTANTMQPAEIKTSRELKSLKMQL